MEILSIDELKLVKGGCGTRSTEDCQSSNSGTVTLASGDDKGPGPKDDG